MKKDDIKKNLGKEVELDIKTHPYTDTNGTIPEIDFSYDSILLTDQYDFGNVVICFYYKGDFVKSQTIRCSHLKPKQGCKLDYLQWVEIESTNVNVEYYSKSLERWDNILNISIAELKIQTSFRVAPKYIYLEGNYCEEDLLHIIQGLK